MGRWVGSQPCGRMNRSSGPSTKLHRFFGSTCEGPYYRTAVLAWHPEEKAVEAIGLKPEAMPPGGMGWRSASLPVWPGTSSRQARLQDHQIVPAKPEGGAKAGLVFTDWTGTVVKSYWFPMGGEGQPRRSSTWARLKQRIAVPAGANRVQWFLGVDAASGTAAFRAVRCGRAATTLILPFTCNGKAFGGPL